MTIVADPVAIPRPVKFTANIDPAVGPVVTKYDVQFFKNSVSLGVPAVVVYRDIPVVNGDVVCIRVTPINDAGRGPTVEECVTVDWLPALPEAPVFTVSVP